jgi:hypothetical protein
LLVSRGFTLKQFSLIGPLTLQRVIVLGHLVDDTLAVERVFALEDAESIQKHRLVADITSFFWSKHHTFGGSLSGPLLQRLDFHVHHAKFFFETTNLLCFVAEPTSYERHNLAFLGLRRQKGQNVFEAEATHFVRKQEPKHFSESLFRVWLRHQLSLQSVLCNHQP